MNKEDAREIFGNWGTIRVRAERGVEYVMPAFYLDVPHLAAYKFGLHKTVEPDHLWTVTEATTGMAVLKPNEREEDAGDAIDSALEKLGRYTIEQFQKIYNQSTLRSTNA